MEKVIIVYGSTTGTTEEMSQIINQEMKSSDLDVTVKNVSNSNPEELSEYELIILGCSTWGDGELQDDFIAFEEGMKDLKLEGKKAAVFGPGDTMYEQFCNAVDILEERLKERGVEIVSDSLKIDGDVEPQLEKVKEWGKILGQRLK